MSQQGILGDVTSPLTDLETLTGNTGGTVGPDGAFNINIVGSAPISVAGNPGTNTLTIDTDGTVPITFTEDSGSATAAADNLNISGGTNMNTSGAGSTVTINLDADVLNLTDLTVDNLELNGNTLSSTDVNGVINLTANGTGGVVIPTDLTVGTTTQDVLFTINGIPLTSLLAIHASGATDLGGFVAERHSDTASFGSHALSLRSRGAEGAPTVVQSGDALSRYISGGYDGTDYALSSEIRTEVDGTPGADDMPGRIILLTSADGTQTPIEGLRLDSSQIITLANALPVGSGGTGATTLTDGGILLGSGTGAITATAQPTNGQLLIGSTGVDPVLATLTAGAGITITEGAGSITIAGIGEEVIAITSLTDANDPYTVLTTDYYMSCNVNGGILTIDLPDAPTTGKVFIVKDSGGDAATNNITVTTTGGVVTIDGATSRVISTNYASLQFVFNGSSYEVF